MTTLANVVLRLQRLEAAHSAPLREYSELERGARLAAIILSNDMNPRRVRIRQIVASARARTAFA